MTEGVTVDDEQQIKSAIARKLSSDGGSGASVSESPDKDDDKQLKHRLQRQKAQSRKTFRFRKSRRGGAFPNNKDEEGECLEEIALTDTNANKTSNEVTLAEEESSSILEHSRDKDDICLDKDIDKGINKDLNNDSNESLNATNETSALLKGEDKAMGSQSSLLMVFPFVDDDANDDIRV